jgi:hypothetical protein
MAFKLPVGSKNIRRNQENSNAKLTVTPHRCSKVMVKQTRRRNNWSWEELTKQFTSNFKLTYKRPASIEEVKAC